MNSLGKTWICQEITKKIPDLLSPKSDNLPIHWKAPHSTDATSKYSSNSTTLCSLVMNQRPVKKEKHQQQEMKIFYGLKSVI